MDKNAKHSLVLMSLILLCFLVSHLPSSEAATLSTAQAVEYADELARKLADRGINISVEEADDLVARAHVLSMEVFEDNRTKCESLTQRMLDMFCSVAGVDVVVIYNSGGWGRQPSDDDDEQWGNVVNGIQSTLEENWGYDVIVLPYGRTERDLKEYAAELKELLWGFTWKAEELAVQVKFLTQNSPNTRVIVTGLSQGGVFTNEVMKILESHERVYGIEAGLAFYYQRQIVESDNTLLIGTNGSSSDPLIDGKVRVLLENLVLAHVRWIADGFEGGLFGFGGYFDVPGHDYDWSSQRIRMLVSEFLEEHFGGQGELAG